MIKRTKVVKVTQAHITAGKRSSKLYCPIALALKAAGLYNVRVGPCIISARRRSDGLSVKWNLPRLAVDFIERFDSGEQVRAFEFRLTTPISGAL